MSSPLGSLQSAPDPHPTKWKDIGLTVIAVVIVLGLIRVFSKPITEDVIPVARRNTSSPASGVVVVVDRSPIYLKLAAIDCGTTDVPTERARQWEIAMKRMVGKVELNDERIGEMLVAGHRELIDKGKRLSLLDFTRLVDEYLVPPPSAALRHTSFPEKCTIVVMRYLEGKDPIRNDTAPY
jgi:hypothetical protein